ncbi:MAG TPA: 2-hydroxy-3-oxopropionate reductase [bacterium]|nr:2-hydroxy-3-oxopropionate reductase [bacterium]
MENIGFIGLGIMGKPMAGNLIRAGHRLVVFDIRPEPVEELVRAGAKAAKSTRDVALQSDIVLTMLPNSPEVIDVVLGEEGAIEGMKPGTVLIDMSSIDPLVSREISEKLKHKGVAMLDAPVSGGEPKAVDGTLAIMAGGPREIFDRVKDILGVMGATVTHVGEIGSGNTAKLANQIIVALNIAAMSEAMVLATRAGVDPEKVFQAIRGGLAGSTALEAKMPLILDGQFKPGFRIELHLKDIRNVLDTARKLDAPVILSEKMMEILRSLAEEGKGKDDHGGIVQYYEKLAGVKVRRKTDGH